MNTTTQSATGLPFSFQPTGPRRSIVHLSEQSDVNMSEQWFEMATPDHFWIIRRCEVLQRLFVHHLQPGLTYGEIGCGHGIVQGQLEERFGLTVDGFDLGLTALEQNRSRAGSLYYYHILDRRADLKSKYDVLFLFDVLEHIADEDAFLQASLFLLKPGGILLINVPARQELYSKYDLRVGHARRYRFEDFARLAASHQLTLLEGTYWGLPFYPLLLARKFLLARLDESAVVETGFDPPGRLANHLLKLYGRLEILPQRWLGTSIMVALRKLAE